MTTTESRPAPTPPRAGDPQPVAARQRKPHTADSRDADGDLKIPQGAVGFSWTYTDADGKEVTSLNGPVPVNDENKRTHIELVCDDCGHHIGLWRKVGSRAIPICPLHKTPMHPADQKPPAAGMQIPWSQIWDSQRDRFRAFVLPTAATFAAGVVADQADLPWWGEASQFAAAGAVVWGSWLTAKMWLTRRDRQRRNLDGEDATTGRRRRALLAKRARLAGYCGFAAAAWVQIADVLGIDVTQPSGIALVGALVAAGLVGSRPYLKWVDEAKKARPVVLVEPDEDPVDDTPQPTDHDLLVAYVQQRWQKLSAPGKRLVGTTVEQIAATTGDGWSGTLVAGEDSDLDPEKYSSEATIRMVARAYAVGTNMVTITADRQDANRALILVQRNSPLSKKRDWDGTGINPATGRAETMTADDGTRASHPFFRPGWGPPMELIAGATGGGKSEYLNLLIAMERQSGMCVSWVCDPQMGQTLGDLRDGVDWFAPDTEELLLMLRTAVMVMYARNINTTRMRVTQKRIGRDGVEREVQRRVKYVEVSPERPLLTITVDEAHIPMGDPDHGREIVKLMSLIAKSGRKSNIKLRLLTQSPLLEELKSSVLRSQLSSGVVVVFRTADKLTGAAAWPGKMPADPAELPAVWPDGSLAAGVCYMSNAKPMRHRADYAGDIYDVITEGETLSLEADTVGTAGPVYADRWKRLAVFDSTDPAELLGVGIPAGLLGGVGSSAANPSAGDGKTGGKEAVLRVLSERWLEGDREPVPFGEIAKAVASVVKTRACTNACNKLVEEQIVENIDGAYRLTESGAEQLDLADEREESYA